MFNVLPNAELTLSSTVIGLAVGSTYAVDILNGSGQYSFEIAGDAVELQADTLVATTPGVATVIVQDELIGCEGQASPQVELTISVA